MIFEEMELWKIKFYSDKSLMKIFQTLVDTPKTARQISYECNISITTVYRKLKSLKNKKLIKTSSMIIDGRRSRLYQKNPKGQVDR